MEGACEDVRGARGCRGSRVILGSWIFCCTSFRPVTMVLPTFCPPSISEVVTAVELQRNFRKEGSTTTEISDVKLFKALEILGD